MIIIEGPDGSGKTTLAHALATRCGLLYRHMGPPEPGMDHVEWYLERVGPYVWDRFHLGEETYGACGFSRRGTWEQREGVRDALRAANTIVVVLYAEKFKDLRPHHNELYTEIQRRAVNARYKGIACDRRKLHWTDYAHDVSAGWPDERWISEIVSAHEARRPKIAPPVKVYDPCKIQFSFEIPGVGCAKVEQVDGECDITVEHNSEFVARFESPSLVTLRILETIPEAAMRAFFRRMYVHEYKRNLGR